MKAMRAFSSLRVLAALGWLLGVSASAATITITSVSTPLGSVTPTGNPSLIGNYAGGPGELTWNGVGFEVINAGGLANLAVFGSFACTGGTTCSGRFSADFIVEGADPGLNLQLGLSGSYIGGPGFALSAIVDPQVYPSTNGSIGPLLLNGTFAKVPRAFNILTPAVDLGAVGNFTGTLFLDFSLAPGSNISLPRGTTADLFLAPTGSTGVPEPTTLGILVSAGALLAYLRRMKK